MWQLKDPSPVKLIVGILAASRVCAHTAVKTIQSELGDTDFVSDLWPFAQTDYYKDQTGPDILRQFVSIEKLIAPCRLAKIKHTTNGLEQQLAEKMRPAVTRPVNLDPGYIELSKLVLATTKNYSHRIYIGDRIFAEVTLVYKKGFQPLGHTYPDYKQRCYLDFFEKIRAKLLEQLKSQP